MPHKRAKLSARQSERAKRGSDLAPTGGVPLAQESVPKSMARVLQAEGVRKTYREKRSQSDHTSGDREGQREPKRRKTDGGVQKSLGIKHGESLAKYNRRVEEEMRIPVAEAMHISRSTARRARKLDQVAKDVKAAKVASSKLKPGPSDKPIAAKEVSTPDLPAPSLARKTEFDQRAPTTRLNDIVQAPPSLTRLPRGAAKRKAQGGSMATKSEDVVSMAQRQRMEEERERAIKRYRELKELRAAA